MATRQLMKKCSVCGKPTLHIGPSTSHLLHLVLTVCTFGAWSVIWLLLAVNANTQSQCTACGCTAGLFGSVRKA